MIFLRSYQQQEGMATLVLTLGVIQTSLKSSYSKPYNSVRIFQVYRMLEKLWFVLRDSLSHFIEYSMQAVCSLSKDAVRGSVIHCSR
jgi:hypothetical protein